MESEKLREELAQVLADAVEEPEDLLPNEHLPISARDYRSADAILASGIIQREVNEAVAGAYLAAVNTIRTTNVMHGDHYGATYAPSADASELVQAVDSLTPTDARVAFDDAVRAATWDKVMGVKKSGYDEGYALAAHERAVLIAELETTVESLDAMAESLVWKNRQVEAEQVARIHDDLAAIIAKHKPQEKA